MIDFGKYLQSRGVKLSEFGVGTNKTLFQFYLEVRERQTCHLKEVAPDNEDGVGLQREVELLRIRLIAEVHKRKRLLSQEEEFLDDGRQRSTTQLLVKKYSESEDWREVMRRAIFQRLGVDEELQKECFQVDEASMEYHEEIQPSQGYVGIPSQYNIRTVTVHVDDPEHPDLARIGLPRGNDFVTKEGEMVAGKGGSVHVWTWAPAVEEEDEAHTFVGTAYEDLRQKVFDVEHLVLQTSSEPKVKALGLDPPLKQALEKLKQASEMLFDIDRTIAKVDVKQLMGNVRHGGPTKEVLTDLAHFITSNFTRSIQPVLQRTASTGASEQLVGNFATEDVSVPCDLDPIEPQLQKISDGLEVWGYDFFELHRESGSHVLENYGAVVLVPLCTSAMKCMRVNVNMFLNKVSTLYNDNPYHGALHATQVCHLANWLIRGLGLVERQAAIENAAFVIAALCHDVKHFGRNNAFCVNTEHPLALRYCNSKVLENMHTATCLELLQDEGMLTHLRRSDRALVRSHIIEYILATDMAEHFEVISKFRGRSEAPDFGVAAEADRRFVARMCLKAGDIGHSALPWELHTEWSTRVQQEFYDQGDSERSLGLPISALCDRVTAKDIAKSQKGFLEFVCLPLFEVLADHHMECERERERQLCEKEEQEQQLANLSQESLNEGSVPELPRKRRSARRLSSGHSGVMSSGIQGSCIAHIRSNVEKWMQDVKAVEAVQERLNLPPSPNDPQTRSGP